MRQGLFRRHVFKIGKRRLPKGATTGCEHQSQHFAVRSAAQTLVDGAVSAVHRQQFALPALFAAAITTSSPAVTRTSLFGERDGLTQLDRFVSGFEPDDAHGCGNNDVRLVCVLTASIPSRP